MNLQSSIQEVSWLKMEEKIMGVGTKGKKKKNERLQLTCAI